MNQVAPAIYVPRMRPAGLSATGRLASLAVGLGALGVLLVAVWIQPSSSGIGSHQKLGLEPCQFQRRTGVPCPTCGMTTSFAHFVRGSLPASLYVQPIGFLLALATAMTVWVGLYAAATGRPVYRLLRFVPTKYYLLPLMGLVVAAWAWKIWIHVTGRDGWGG